MARVILLASIATFFACDAFVFAPRPFARTSHMTSMMTEVKSDEGSESSSSTQKLSGESPLLDRALDSALDFLQDAEGPVDEEDDSEFDMFEIYADSPDIDIPYDLIAELEQKELTALENKQPRAAVFNKQSIDAAVAKWRKHDNDCGSAEVQVAIANEKVKYLTKHLLENKKDRAAKRGLTAIVTARRKFLNYLYEHDQQKALEMVSEMGIRFRPPGRSWEKTAKYGAFRNTKNKMTRAGKLKSAVVNN